MPTKQIVDVPPKPALQEQVSVQAKPTKDIEGKEPVIASINSQLEDSGDHLDNSVHDVSLGVLTPTKG